MLARQFTKRVIEKIAKPGAAVAGKHELPLHPVRVRAALLAAVVATALLALGYSGLNPVARIRDYRKQEVYNATPLSALGAAPGSAEIWLGTEGGGIQRLAASRLLFQRPLTTAQGLSDNWVVDLGFNDTGLAAVISGADPMRRTTQIATVRGPEFWPIPALDDSAFPGLTDAKLVTVGVTRGGTICVATRGLGLGLYHPEARSWGPPVTAADGLGSDNVNDVLSGFGDGGEGIWVATRSALVYGELRDDRLNVGLLLAVSTDLAGEPEALTVGNRSLWYRTRGGGLGRVRVDRRGVPEGEAAHEILVSERTMPGVEAADVQCAVMDAAGRRLWLAGCSAAGGFVGRYSATPHDLGYAALAVPSTGQVKLAVDPVGGAVAGVVGGGHAWRVQDLLAERVVKRADLGVLTSEAIAPPAPQQVVDIAVRGNETWLLTTRDNAAAILRRGADAAGKATWDAVVPDTRFAPLAAAADIAAVAGDGDTMYVGTAGGGIGRWTPADLRFDVFRRGDGPQGLLDDTSRDLALWRGGLLQVTGAHGLAFYPPGAAGSWLIHDRGAGLAEPPVAVAVRGPVVAVAAGDRIGLFDGRTLRWQGFEHGSRAVALALGAQRLWTLDEDRCLRTHELTGNPGWNRRADEVIGFAHDDGQVAALANGGQTLLLFDEADAAEKLRLTVGPLPERARTDWRLAASRGDRLYLAGSERALHIYDLRTRRWEVKPLPRQVAVPHQLAATTDCLWFVDDNRKLHALVDDEFHLDLAEDVVEISAGTTAVAALLAPRGAATTDRQSGRLLVFASPAAREVRVGEPFAGDLKQANCVAFRDQALVVGAAGWIGLYDWDRHAWRSIRVPPQRTVADLFAAGNNVWALTTGGAPALWLLQEDGEAAFLPVKVGENALEPAVVREDRDGLFVLGKSGAICRVEGATPTTATVVLAATRTTAKLPEDVRLITVVGDDLLFYAAGAYHRYGRGNDDLDGWQSWLTARAPTSLHAMPDARQVLAGDTSRLWLTGQDGRESDPVPAPGRREMAVAATAVYVAAADPRVDGHRLVQRHAVDGGRLGEAQAVVGAGLGPTQPTTQVVTDGRTVIRLAQDGQVGVYDPGRRTWWQELGKVDVLWRVGSHVYAWQQQVGSVSWRVPSPGDGAAVWQPLAMPADCVVTGVVPSTHGAALWLSNGDLAWLPDPGGLQTIVHAPALAVGDLVAAGEMDGTLLLLDSNGALNGYDWSRQDWVPGPHGVSRLLQAGDRWLATSLRAGRLALAKVERQRDGLALTPLLVPVDVAEIVQAGTNVFLLSTDNVLHALDPFSLAPTRVWGRLPGPPLTAGNIRWARVIDGTLHLVLGGADRTTVFMVELASATSSQRSYPAAMLEILGGDRTVYGIEQRGEDRYVWDLLAPQSRKPVQLDRAVTAVRLAGETLFAGTAEGVSSLANGQAFQPTPLVVHPLPPLDQLASVVATTATMYALTRNGRLYRYGQDVGWLPVATELGTDGTLLVVHDALYAAARQDGRIQLWLCGDGGAQPLPPLAAAAEPWVARLPGNVAAFPLPGGGDPGAPAPAVVISYLDGDYVVHYVDRERWVEPMPAMPVLGTLSCRRFASPPPAIHVPGAATEPCRFADGTAAHLHARADGLFFAPDLLTELAVQGDRLLVTNGWGHGRVLDMTGGGPPTVRALSAEEARAPANEPPVAVPPGTFGACTIAAGDGPWSGPDGTRLTLTLAVDDRSLPLVPALEQGCLAHELVRGVAGTSVEIGGASLFILTPAGICSLSGREDDRPRPLPPVPAAGGAKAVRGLPDALAVTMPAGNWLYTDEGWRQAGQSAPDPFAWTNRRLHQWRLAGADRLERRCGDAWATIHVVDRGLDVQQLGGAGVVGDRLMVVTRAGVLSCAADRVGTDEFTLANELAAPAAAHAGTVLELPAGRFLLTAKPEQAYQAVADAWRPAAWQLPALAAWRTRPLAAAADLTWQRAANNREAVRFAGNDLHFDLACGRLDRDTCFGIGTAGDRAWTLTSRGVEALDGDAREAPVPVPPGCRFLVAGAGTGGAVLNAQGEPVLIWQEGWVDAAKFPAAAGERQRLWLERGRWRVTRDHAVAMAAPQDPRTWLNVNLVDGRWDFEQVAGIAVWRGTCAAATLLGVTRLAARPAPPLAIWRLPYAAAEVADVDGELWARTVANQGYRLHEPQWQAVALDGKQLRPPQRSWSNDRWRVKEGDYGRVSFAVERGSEGHQPVALTAGDFAFDVLHHVLVDGDANICVSSADGLFRRAPAGGDMSCRHPTDKPWELYLDPAGNEVYAAAGDDVLGLRSGQWAPTGVAGHATVDTCRGTLTEGTTWRVRTTADKLSFGIRRQGGFEPVRFAPMEFTFAMDIWYDAVPAPGGGCYLACAEGLQVLDAAGQLVALRHRFGDEVGRPVRHLVRQTRAGAQRLLLEYGGADHYAVAMPGLEASPLTIEEYQAEACRIAADTQGWGIHRRPGAPRERRFAFAWQDQPTFLLTVAGDSRFAHELIEAVACQGDRVVLGTRLGLTSATLRQTATATELVDIRPLTQPFVDDPEEPAARAVPWLGIAPDQAVKAVTPATGEGWQLAGDPAAVSRTEDLTVRPAYDGRIVRCVHPAPGVFTFSFQPGRVLPAGTRPQLRAGTFTFAVPGTAAAPDRDSVLAMSAYDTFFASPAGIVQLDAVGGFTCLHAATAGTPAILLDQVAAMYHTAAVPGLVAESTGEVPLATWTAAGNWQLAAPTPEQARRELVVAPTLTAGHDRGGRLQVQFRASDAAEGTWLRDGKVTADWVRDLALGDDRVVAATAAGAAWLTADDFAWLRLDRAAFPSTGVDRVARAAVDGKHHLVAVARGDDGNRGCRWQDDHWEAGAVDDVLEAASIRLRTPVWTWRRHPDGVSCTLATATGRDVELGSRPSCRYPLVSHSRLIVDFPQCLAWDPRTGDLLVGIPIGVRRFTVDHAAGLARIAGFDIWRDDVHELGSIVALRTASGRVVATSEERDCYQWDAALRQWQGVDAPPLVVHHDGADWLVAAAADSFRVDVDGLLSTCWRLRREPGESAPIAAVASGADVWFATNRGLYRVCCWRTRINPLRYFNYPGDGGTGPWVAIRHHAAATAPTQQEVPPCSTTESSPR